MAPVALDAGIVGPLLRERLPAALRDALPAARWYGDKGRPIVDVTVDDLAFADDGPVAFAVVGVRFRDGESRYLLPLSFSSGQAAASALLTLPGQDGELVVGDALLDPSFPAWLLDRLDGGPPLQGNRGRFDWHRLTTAGDALRQARGETATVSAAEQSNSSIRYDAALFAKLFRRLRPGVNPDEEISRHLAERTSFANLPRPVATGGYLEYGGDRSAVAFAQAFVPSLGDGWSWTLARLQELLDPHRREIGATSALSAWLDAARRLGARTGQLHAALAVDAGDPAFTPEPIVPEQVRSWEETLRSRLTDAVSELTDVGAARPSPERTLVDRLGERMPALLRRAAGFGELRGGVAIRVHGDYHLGQVLKTADDWVVLDFEGEPARPLEARRAKTSALKDVAGMLRSFAYARGAALRSLPAPSGEQRAAAAAWEAEGRSAFLAAYRAATDRAFPPLVPADPDAFAAALAAWELDKAVYEIDYERRNRPDWLDIPLASLLGEG